MSYKKQSLKKISTKDSTRRQFIKNTIPGAAALGLGAGGLIMHHSSDAAEQTPPINLTGIWQMRLTPIFNLSEQNNLEPIDRELVLYDRDGALAGFIWIFHVQGSSIGDKVSLRIFQPNGIDEVISTASIEGKVRNQEGKVIIDGTYMMSSPSFGVEGISLAEFFAERTANDEATLLEKITSNQLEVETIDPRKLCELLDINKILTKIIEGLTDDLPITVLPMDVCDPNKNGRGYYLLGDVGPGRGSRPYATATIYFPFEPSIVTRCISDTYHFNIYEDGESKGVAELLEALKKATGLLKALGLNFSDLEKHILEFVGEFGDFAFCSGVSSHTFRPSLYIVVSRISVDCDAVENSMLVKDIKKLFKHEVDLFCGPHIRDRFSLVRGDVCNLPFVPIKDPFVETYTPVLFVYWFGTIKVKFD